MNLLQILALLWPLLVKYAPILLAAEQALAKGGVAGLIAYLKTLISSNAQPALTPQLSPLVAHLETAHAAAAK